MSDKGAKFLSDRLQEVLSELDAVRAAFRAQTARLHECEGILRFYANPNNYRAVRDDVSNQVNQNVLTADSEPVGNTSAHTFVAGKKAREYFQKIGAQE